MDETLLCDEGIENVGLVLRDEESIIQEENGVMLSENDKNQIKINNTIMPESPINDSDKQDIERISHAENNFEDEKPEQNFNGYLGDENKYLKSNKTVFDNILRDETESENICERIEGMGKYEKNDGCQKTNGLELLKTPVNEQSKINSKMASPLEAYIECNKSKSKTNDTKEIAIKANHILMGNEEDTLCGIGFFKPRFLQRFATVHVYVIFFSIMGILQGSYYTYLNGSLSTLEKRFAFKSKTSGLIMSVDEITPILIAMFIGYYATKAHRPRLVALGCLMSAACCFVTCMPYFVYGSTQNLMFADKKNNAGHEFCDAKFDTKSCNPDRPQNVIAVILFLFGSFLKGFGNLAYYTIGLSYMDDNSSKKSTPIYLAIALALRLLGPLVGFLMSSGFLKYYENPMYDPGFGPDDPRWIGAWWMGFFLQGILLVIFTIPIALFPRRLPGQKIIQKVDAAPTEDGLKDIFTGLISALKRLGKNPVFIILILNTTMKIFGHFGHAIMLPKYMENQFRLSASEASLYSGATTIVCIILSTLLGGFLIWKFTPRIKIVLGGMIASETIVCVCYLILLIPRCQTSEMLHFGTNEEGLVLNSVCNKNCDCSTSSFTPFCGPDKKTLFFSPCYAGCTEEVTSITAPKSNKQFSNCSCVDQQQLGATITEGFCPDESCRSQAIIYLVILFFMVTISNLFTVAATMILLRSVHPSDKSVALGTFETFVCLFGFIPFPVTFGALVDSACLVWEKSCGETGNCWFYDVDKYGYLIHGASSIFCALSVICLTILYFLSHRVRNLYIEEDEEEEPTKYVDIKLDTVSGSVTKL